VFLKYSEILVENQGLAYPTSVVGDPVVISPRSLTSEN